VDVKEPLDEALLLSEKAEGGGFILLRKGGIARDVSEDDGSEPTLSGHGQPYS